MKTVTVALAETIFIRLSTARLLRSPRSPPASLASPVSLQPDLSQLETDYPNLQVPNDRSRIHIGNLKATPLVVSGVLYVTTPLYQAAALDPATGETLWVYDPKSYASGIPEMLLGFNNRGLAHWTDGEQERILWATGDAYLIAVDAKTGEPITDFGQGGKVDLIAGIPRADRRPPINYSVSSAPIVLRDVVVVGSASSDQPRHKEAPPAT